MKKLRLQIISHTHWDREWYQSFQKYRYRLVRMMDNLIKGLEEDEAYKVFHLDGQTIVLEDYLAVRPEMEQRLRKLIEDRRILVGPWYVMPDEFLISGESLIKNLRMGIAICTGYKTAPIPCGYSTDIFGHNSQTPQILNGFDIHNSLLYRGIADYDKDAFRWESPDGSSVVAAKLEGERSYSNFYFAVRWPYEESGFDEEDAVKRLKALVERAREHAASDIILMMDGVDHCGMEPELPHMLEVFRKNLPDVEIVHGPLQEYFDQIDPNSLQTIQGSLYNVGVKGVNNQVLKNVLSSMVHIKQANDTCETELTRFSEPMNAFCTMLDKDLQDFRRDDYALTPRRTYLDLAWKYLITNHAHDSICGCSISDVHRDNEYRYRQARQIAEISAEDCLQQLTRNIHCTGEHQEAVLIYNPTQEPVDGMTVFQLPLKFAPGANRRYYNSCNERMAVQVLDESPEVKLSERLLQLISFPMEGVKTVAADLHIPPFGYTVVYSDVLQTVFDPGKKMYGPEVLNLPDRLNGSQMIAHNRIDNGKLLVELTDVGLLKVTVKETGKTYENLHLLEDRSDKGEGWNWIPVEFDSTIYNRNNLEQFSVVADGPCCTRWKLRWSLPLPDANAEDGRHRGGSETRQLVTTYVTVPKDSMMLSFTTEIDNHADNHRVRVCFPTGSSAEHFYTKTPFAMTQWPVAHPDTSFCMERDTLVHPSQGITAMEDGGGWIGLYAKGLYEVEVTDNAEKSINLTLFRAAASETGTTHPQDIRMQRKMQFAYALDFGASSMTQLVKRGEAFRADLCSYFFEQNPKAKALESSRSLLSLESDTKLLSTIYEEDGAIYVRLYDVSGCRDTAVLHFAKKVRSAEYVNLNHAASAPAAFERNTVTVSCGHHQIVTVCVQLEA